MQKQDYSYLYLWRHPEKYKRIRAEDIISDEGAIELCEVILKEIHHEMKNEIASLRLLPNYQSVREDAIVFDEYLRSKAISSISFGGSIILADQFRRKCPKDMEWKGTEMQNERC